MNSQYSACYFRASCLTSLSWLGLLCFHRRSLQAGGFPRDSAISQGCFLCRGDHRGCGQRWEGFVLPSEDGCSSQEEVGYTGGRIPKEVGYTDDLEDVQSGVEEKRNSTRAFQTGRKLRSR